MQSQARIAQTERGPVEYSDVGEGEVILYFHGTGITCDGMMPIEKVLYFHLIAKSVKLCSALSAVRPIVSVDTGPVIPVH